MHNNRGSHLDLLSDLNPKQKEAVLASDGPVLILAGAGSGKTKALTTRIAYLISEKSVDPEKVLAITFTNKAAKEMQSRVKNLLLRSGFSLSVLPTIGTFHSVCARVLRQDGECLGLDKNYIIFDEEDSFKLIKRCLKKLNYEDRSISISGFRAQISSAKNEMIGPKEFLSFTQGYRAEIVAEIYDIYQKELIKNNALDFDDLLFKTVELFRKCPEVLIKYQEKWRYLLIDEYQDTNRVQYLFAKMLAEKSQNICVVGDDWQSIYGWRGADYQNILNFERDWPKVKIIKLEQNYRSTKAILSAAQSVIEKNNQRSHKKLWTDNEPGNPIYVYEAKNEGDEAEYIIKEVKVLLARKVQLSDIAIFYRTNAQSRALEEKLIRSSLPYKIIGSVRFYARKEIKDILAWLRIVSGSNDWISFERSLLAPPCGVGSASFSKLQHYANQNAIKINDLLKDASLLNFLSEKVKKNFVSYAEKILKIREAAQISLSEAIRSVIEISGYKDYLSDGTLQNEERLENLQELLSVAEEYENLNPKITVTDFLDEISLYADIDDYREENESLTLMTLHTAKGLEFKVVFIVGLEENIFPHVRSLFDSSELEEERRLFYVGITRAKERLYLLYANKCLYFGNIQSNQPSRFLTEIPPSLLHFVGFDDRSLNKKILEENIPGVFRAGEKVEHEIFGVGEVIKSVEDELTVYFPEYGEKTISVYYAPIRRVN